MSIVINDVSICETCINRNCSFRDAQLKTNFHGLRTETTVCPTSYLSESPLNISSHSVCINCALCQLSCHNNNLMCSDLEYDSDSFNNLTDTQANSIACSYLNHLFGFAANTNRNKSMQFDGYVSTSHGIEAFVEVVKKNDSLECVRRILGDSLLYSPYDREINNGIVVLHELPKKGSHDVYNVLESIKNFPATDNFNFYFVTFNLLRFLALNICNESLQYTDILLDINDCASIQSYIKRLIESFPSLKNLHGTLNKILYDCGSQKDHGDSSTGHF